LDPDLRAFMWLTVIMLAAGSALSITLHSLWWLVGGFFLLAVVGLVSLTRSQD
jgi:hypothetical protein